MGKGDQKSRRGKVTNGSYGKSRMRKESSPVYDKVETAVAEKEEAKPVEKKKAPAKKAEPEAKAEKSAVKEKEEKVETPESADESADKES